MVIAAMTLKDAYSLNYCDIEWFALETNRDHPVVFEIASKLATPIFYILQRKKLQLRRIKWHTQHHTTSGRIEM